MPEFPQYSKNDQRELESGKTAVGLTASTDIMKHMKIFMSRQKILYLHTILHLLERMQRFHLKSKWDFYHVDTCIVNNIMSLINCSSVFLQIRKL